MNSSANQISTFTQKANSSFLKGMGENYDFNSFTIDAEKFVTFLDNNPDIKMSDSSREQNMIFNIQKNIVMARIAFEAIQSFQEIGNNSESPNDDVFNNELMTAFWGGNNDDTINSYKKRYNKYLARYIEKRPENQISLENSFVEVPAEVAA